MGSTTIALAGGARATAAVRGVLVLARRLAKAHAELRRRARVRAELASLDEHALRDLGIDCGEVGWYLAGPHAERRYTGDTRREHDDCLP